MQSIPLLIASILLFVVAMVVVALVQSALSGIYTAVLYLYTTEGIATSHFDPQMIQGAFREKQSRR